MTIHVVAKKVLNNNNNNNNNTNNYYYYCNFCQETIILFKIIYKKTILL